MSAYYHQSFKVILDYHYHNSVPIKLIYNDGSEEVIDIISYYENREKEITIRLKKFAF